jgi:CubicO group peptidase (beta-lactamase class C family)
MSKRKRYLHIRRIQRCVLAISLLALCLMGTASATAAQPTPDIAAIDAYIETQMRELRIPGLALGIVQGDQVVHLKGFGVAGPDGRAVTPQTPFQINSLVKPMTGVAVMQLAEQGKIDLDTPVQSYLPWFRVADEAASAQITPRHLLYHTSGLPTTAGMEYALSGDDRVDALEQRVRALGSVQLDRPVGATYEYSNAGYQILGLLVQQISGQPYETYMREHIFAPLQMRQTFTDWSQARAQGAASGHRYWFGVPVAADLPVNRANLPAGAHTSASAQDVAHFLIAQLNGGRFGTTALLSAPRIAEMQQPVIPQGDGHTFYAMDWTVAPIGDVTTLVKPGAGADFFSLMSLLPERRLGLVVLMNANKGLGSPLGDQRLMGLPYNVAEMLLGQQPTALPADPKPTVLYTILFLAVIVQAAGMARTALRLFGWKRRPGQQPHGRRAIALGLWLPLALNLGWGLFALVGVPALFGMSLSLLGYLAPDFGLILLESGATALLWGVVRTALVWRTFLTAQTEASLIIGAPVKA